MRKIATVGELIDALSRLPRDARLVVSATEEWVTEAGTGISEDKEREINAVYDLTTRVVIDATRCGTVRVEDG